MFVVPCSTTYRKSSFTTLYGAPIAAERSIHGNAAPPKEGRVFLLGGESGKCGGSSCHWNRDNLRVWLRPALESSRQIARKLQGRALSGSRPIATVLFLDMGSALPTAIKRGSPECPKLARDTLGTSKV